MATIPGAVLLASNPGPAAHLALVAVVVVIALIVLAVSRRRNTRSAQAQRLDDPPRNQHHRSEPDERPHGDSGRH